MLFRSERAVTVGEGEWKLPGTLTVPAGTGPFPAVVLVHGSGPNDRDETVGGTKVFKDLAEGLASRGIVGGMILAFARALGEFGATIMVAGNIPGKTSTLSLAIFQSVQLGQDANAFRLLGVSVVLAFAAVWWSEWLIRRGKR